MANLFRKSQLSKARLSLVETMRALEHGRIEKLMVLNGQPEFTLDTRILREVKFGSKSQVSANLQCQDNLRVQHQELFTVLDRMGSGVIEVIQVQNGLPFRLAAEGMV